MESKIRPILRWPGGKRTKIIQFTNFFHSKFREKLYVDSCIGSGAFLFAHLPKKAVINDINEQLMNVYEVVRDHPQELIAELLKHTEKDSEDHFYEVRDRFNQHIADVGQSIEMAGLLLYLNCRCFNGLYRVNKEGKFNVGWCHESRKVTRFEGIIDNIWAQSKYLKTIEIRCGSYDLIPPNLSNAFYFLDPPYDQGFTQYDTYEWGEEQFNLLRSYVDRINEAGNQFLLCNLATPFIEELFKGYVLKYHNVARYISCNGAGRKPVREIVIMNYLPFQSIDDYR